MSSRRLKCVSPGWMELGMPQTHGKAEGSGLQGSSSTWDFQDSEKFKGKNGKGLNLCTTCARPLAAPLSPRRQGICRAVLGTENACSAPGSPGNTALAAASTPGDQSLPPLSIPPPWEPGLLPHPLLGDSLELVIVSPLPRFRPAASWG